MVVYDGEVLKGQMPKDFPEHTFTALLQVERTLLHATINGEQIAPDTYAVELPKSDPREAIGRVGTIHLNQLEFGEVVVWP